MNIVDVWPGSATRVNKLPRQGCETMQVSQCVCCTRRSKLGRTHCDARKLAQSGWPSRGKDCIQLWHTKNGCITVTTKDNAPRISRTPSGKNSPLRDNTNYSENHDTGPISAMQREPTEVRLKSHLFNQKEALFQRNNFTFCAHTHTSFAHTQ